MVAISYVDSREKEQQQASPDTFQKCLSESGHSLELAAMSRADPLWPSKEFLQPNEFIRAMLKDDEVRTGYNFRTFLLLTYTMSTIFFATGRCQGFKLQ